MNNLAKLIEKAAKLREESFQHDMAHESETSGKFINPSNLYKLSIRDTVKMASEELELGPEILEPAVMLLSHCWNDALYWANEIMLEET